MSEWEAGSGEEGEEAAREDSAAGISTTSTLGGKRPERDLDAGCSGRDEPQRERAKGRRGKRGGKGYKEGNQGEGSAERERTGSERNREIQRRKSGGCVEVDRRAVSGGEMVKRGGANSRGRGLPDSGWQLW